MKAAEDFTHDISLIVYIQMRLLLSLALRMCLQWVEYQIRNKKTTRISAVNVMIFKNYFQTDKESYLRS